MVLVACTPGLQSGSIDASFSGVKDGAAISPTAVNLAWRASPDITSYDVYANYQKEPIITNVTTTALVESLQPSTEYSFKVTGTGSVAGAVGGDREMKVTTWPRFEGINAVTKDESGNLVVSWKYDYPAEEFLIFYGEEQAPTVDSTANWTVAQATTSERSYTFRDLKNSVRYYFMVQARYRGVEFERTTKTLSEQMNSSFPTPFYELAPITIGTLPSIFVSPTVNDLFTERSYKSLILKDGVVASDPLIGTGKASFSSTFALNLGRVDNITLQVTYKDNKIDETMRIPNLSTYLKGVTNFVDLPAQDTTTPGQAFMGQSLATGDFNCDGYDDLAVGLPFISISQEGVRAPQAGAVYIYYGGYRRADNRYVLKTEAVVPGLVPKRNPVKPGEDPQLITFSDLNEYSAFGSSLAKINLNGDQRGANSCDDLIVGAPMAHNPAHGYQGYSFVFFGGAQGLKSPDSIASFAENTETCDGRMEGAVCTAVKLWPDYRLWPQAEFSSPFKETYSLSGVNVAPGFGTAVSSIGDFNADGYEDLAIGSPNELWDGKPPLESANANWGMSEVGAVFIYFGSPFGIGREKPTVSGNSFRFLKIFPPIPQEGMHFGHSISGGVDVDGAFRVKGTDSKYYGGADFVVGAPFFHYQTPTTNKLPMTAIDNPDLDASITPSDGGWSVAGSYAGTGTNSRYGFSQAATPPTTISDRTGAAFVYFGRSRVTQAGVGAGVDSTDEPLRSDFWQCGRRGMFGAENHFSCLAKKTSFRILFPHNGNAYNFGRAVQMMGAKSVRDSSDNIICAPPAGTPTPMAAAGCSDPNGDGFGEILVSAPESKATTPTRTRLGSLWQFFGNPERIYEAGVGATDNFKSGSPYFNTTPNCANFSLPADRPGNFANDKSVCAPTVLVPNSLATETHLAYAATSLAAGDLNGDGILDLGAGAHYDDTIAQNAGAIYAFLSQRGVGLTLNFKKMILDSSQAGDALGTSVAIGDFDVGAITYRDIASGAPRSKLLRAGGGAVFQFLSGAAPLPATKSIAESQMFDYAAAQQSYEYANSRLVGDVNGDGFEDAIGHLSSYDSTGARSYDAVLNFGSPIGLLTTTFCLANQDRVFKATQASATECYPSKSHNTAILKGDYQLPQYISKPNNLTAQWAEIGFAAGDVNGDGYGDVLFTDPVNSPPTTVLYFGTRGGLQDTVSPSWVAATNDPQILSKTIYFDNSDDYDAGAHEPNRYFNASPVVSGDFNGDGYADIVIGNPNETGPVMPATTPALTGGPGVKVGRWVCSANDLQNANCLNGVGPSDHGSVSIFYGSRRGAQTPSIAGAALGTDVNINAPSAFYKDAYTSETVAAQQACNGKTGGNLCVPAFLRNPVYENVFYGFDNLGHHFGGAVTTMDIDKDGYDDLLVGAPEFFQLSCLTITDEADPDYRRSQGRVYIYKGSEFGILAGAPREYYQSGYNAASYCANITPQDDTGLGVAPGTKLRALNMPYSTWDPYDRNALELTAKSTAGNIGFFSKSGRSFGNRIANVGDINGDGYEDLAVTAYRDSNMDSNNQVILSSGSTYVYYGPLCSTDNTSEVGEYIQSLEKVNKTTKYANNLTDPSISTVALNTDCRAKPLAPLKIFVKDSSLGDLWGISLAGARSKGSVNYGDVNLDGFSDLLIGSPSYSDPVSGATNLGKGIVFFGSNNGLYTDDFASSDFEINADRKIKPYIILPPIRDSGPKFFEGNITAGDVNGDKAMDFMIPSRHFDSSGTNPGINIGTFFLFY